MFVIVSFNCPNLSLSPTLCWCCWQGQTKSVDRSMALKTIQRLLPCKVSPTCKTFSVIFDLDVELLNLNIFVLIKNVENHWWLNARRLTNCPQNLLCFFSPCIWFIRKSSNEVIFSVFERLQRIRIRVEESHWTTWYLVFKRTRLEAAVVNIWNAIVLSSKSLKTKSLRHISLISYMERSNFCMGRSGFDYGAKWLLVGAKWLGAKWPWGEMTGYLPGNTCMRNLIYLVCYRQSVQVGYLIQLSS